MYACITGDPVKRYRVGIMAYTVDRARHYADREPLLAQNILHLIPEMLLSFHGHRMGIY